MILPISAAALGVLAGVLTGMTPGIHPNTVIFTSLPIYLQTEVVMPIYLAFLTGISISHTFHDFLPAIFLSAPDADAALSTISAPEMLSQGRGLEAFRYTVYGGAVSLVAAALAVAPLFLLLQDIYSAISPFMEYVLLFFLLYIILESSDTLESGLLALFSGSLGVISFQVPVNQQFVLVPVFSGLFAVPAVLSLLDTEFSMPEQDEPDISILEGVEGGVTGTAAGLMAGVFPGIGSAVSTSFLTPLMDRSRRNFLAAMGAVNTSDMVFSLVTLQVLGRARSGTSVALKALSVPSTGQTVFLGSLTLFSALLSVPLSIKVSRIYGAAVRELSISRILYLVLLIILSVTILLTGFLGLLVLTASSFLGLAALESGDRKVLMAVLLVPSILFFSGIGIFM